jgi:hypothetical protein
VKKAAVLLLVLVLLGAVGLGTSGQDLVRGTIEDEDGQPLSNCQVDRGLRLGVGFGGFDGPTFSSGSEGQFVLPVNRGFNRLTFMCPGGRDGTASTVVLRGREARVSAVLDEP